MRSHLDEAAGLTVGQLAEVSRVSQPTVIRFARKLGFGGYRELRYVLRHPQEERSVTFDPLEGFDLNPWDNPDDVPGKGPGPGRKTTHRRAAFGHGRQGAAQGDDAAGAIEDDRHLRRGELHVSGARPVHQTHLSGTAMPVQRRRLPAADRRGASDEGRHGHRVLSLRQLRRHRESAETRQIRRRAHHRCHQQHRHPLATGPT